METPKLLATFASAAHAELTVKSLKDRYPHRTFTSALAPSGLSIVKVLSHHSDTELDRMQDFAAGCYYILTGRGT